MSKLLQILLSLVFIAYPFLVYFGLEYFDARYIGLILVTLILIRSVFSNKKDGLKLLFSPFFTIGAVILIAGSIVFNTLAYLTYYPVFVSLFLLIQFAYSLAKPPNIIERIAMATTEDPDSVDIGYTRKVCWVWCCFFVINASIALYTTSLDSLEWWTLYNGFISYIIIGLIFFIELMVRPKPKAPNTNH